jgi:hypothetical protein
MRWFVSGSLASWRAFGLASGLYLSEKESDALNTANLRLLTGVVALIWEMRPNPYDVLPE